MHTSYEFKLSSRRKWRQRLASLLRSQHNSFCRLQMKKASLKNTQADFEGPQPSKVARCVAVDALQAQPLSKRHRSSQGFSSLLSFFQSLSDQNSFSCSRELKGLYSRGRPILEESTNGMSRGSRMTRSGSCPPVDAADDRQAKDGGEENEPDARPRLPQNGRQTLEPQPSAGLLLQKSSMALRSE